MPPIAFLDANVLFSRTLRDWICMLALSGSGLNFHLQWSEDVLAEWINSLRNKHPDLSDQAVGGHRAKLESLFPHARITGYNPRNVPCPPDSGDWHVLAAAVHGKVDYLVTNNIRDFPEGCVQGKLEVISADEFLCFIHGRNPELLADVSAQMLQHWATWGAVATADALAEHLRSAGAAEFADIVAPRAPAAKVPVTVSRRRPSR